MDLLLGKMTLNQDQDLDRKVIMEKKLKIILQLIKLCQTDKTKGLICHLENLKTLLLDIRLIIK
jgi:hypothetical protein